MIRIGLILCLVDKPEMVVNSVLGSFVVICGVVRSVVN